MTVNKKWRSLTQNSDPPAIFLKNDGAISGIRMWKNYEFYHKRFYQIKQTKMQQILQKWEVEEIILGQLR